MRNPSGAESVGSAGVEVEAGSVGVELTGVRLGALVGVCVTVWVGLTGVRLGDLVAI